MSCYYFKLSKEISVNYNKNIILQNSKPLSAASAPNLTEKYIILKSVNRGI